MTAVCRECAEAVPEDWPEAAGEDSGRCPACQSPRIARHPELDRLTIAHIDCDAFYASVEKRDNPDLADKPVIVGGGRRGVVSACCYVARLYGVRSAMPMFKALTVCPDAVVIRPDMEKYSRVGREVRERMLTLTPLVEPLSIDEAFLDLTGTERLHGRSPAQSLIRLVLDIEREIGVTASIGLSFNKFLAKIASDLDKPKGFSAIGRDEALDFLGEKPVGLLWGVGKSLKQKLVKDGIETIGDLRAYDQATLMARYGAIGSRLYRFSRAEDDREVDPTSEAKSISSETTFNQDLSSLGDLNPVLWRLCEKVIRRLKRAELAGCTVQLKLKTDKFQTLTRSRALEDPTQLAERLYRTAAAMLEKEADGRKFRLLGVGLSDFAQPEFADPPDLVDTDRDRSKKVEAAMDAVRAKLGETAIIKGRGLDQRQDAAGLSSSTSSRPRRTKSP
ncbi:MAG: DNA polymerase IV [Alphaproteobacteria bacterium]|nr:DNA polymerase IV [Alphaproteobacteria bacterium]